MRHCGLVLIFTLTFLSLFSQDGEWEAMQKAGLELNGVYHCPSDFAQYNLFKKQPWKKELQQRIDAETYRAIQNNAEQSGIIYTLPVVVHIIHNGVDIITDAQVLTAIQHLNDAFSHQGYYANEGAGTDMEIQFCLAKRAPDGTSTTGITRQQNVLSDMVIEDDDIDMKNLARWDPTQYVNIYVVNEISSISSGAGVAGYAYFPSSHGQPEDGLVCEAQYFGKDPQEDAVMIHEMGHYVNLYHTFQGGCDNGDCLADGDRVCDTPPDEARQTVCVFNSCSTDTDAPSPNPFTSDVDDMTENYMDYSPFECYHRFTEGQKTRAVAAVTGPRGSLLDSKGCVDPCPNPIAVAFTPSATTVEMGVTVFFQNETTGPNSYEWAVDGVPFSTAYNGANSFSAPGLYTVTLTANNGDPLCEQTVSQIIEVTCNVKSDLTVDNNPIDVNQTATFTEQSTNATAFEWYVVNSLEGIGQVFPYTFNFVGVFPVMLVASNPGCADTAIILQRVECDANPAFTTSDQFPLPGQTVTYTNVTSGVGAIEWYLDGILQGTTNSIDFTFTIPGIYTVTLSVDNGNCTETLSMEVRVFTPGNETCDNGIDDDGDGYVDCYDSDCQCFDGVDCKIDTVPAEFATRLAWRNETDRISVNSTPVVANMNPRDDQIPEIIVVEGNGNGLGDQIYFYRGDGSNKGNPIILNFPPNFDRYPGASPSIADIDQDGLPELIVTGADQRIYVYTNYDETANPPMQLMMQSGDDLDEPDSRPYLADFDQDGVAEIFVGTDIFTFDLSNPSSPTITQAIDGPTDYTGNTSYSSYSQGMKNPAAVDILNVADCNGDPDCEGLELAAGPIIYSIDLSTTDGDPMEIKVQRDLRQLTGSIAYDDGYTAVVDADLDGILDVVVTGKKAGSFQTGIYIWNKNGILAEHFSSTSSGGSITCIANFFDDRTEGFAEDYPEILFCKRSVLYCFNLNKALQNQSYPYWWQLSTGDVSGFTGASVYDFNGDGLFEIVYRDEDHLRVLYGGAAPFPPGVDNERNYFKTECGSITADEFPIVVDCDGDDETEIVVTGFTTSGTRGSNYRGRVSIYESDAKPWVPCRNVWNQVNYFVVNVNDDLKIPQEQQAHHLEFPGPGTGNRPFNRYLSQRQILDDQFQSYLPVPDLVGLFDDVQCINDSLRVSYEVCNYGSNDLEPDAPIAFYDNDPTEVDAQLIGDLNYLNDAVFIDSCVLFEAIIPIPANNRIYGVVNDDATLVRPYIWEDDFPSTDQPECQWPNNMFDFVFATTIPTFSLGPDIEVCPGNVTVLDAGAGHRGYRWQDGSTNRFFTASGPGKYWVDVDDSCLPLRSDTIEIIENIPFPFDLGLTTELCEGDSISLTIPTDYTTSTWTLDGDLLCQGCYDVTILPDSVTVIRVTAGITSCYVSDSIRLEILAPPELAFDTIVGFCDDVPGSASVLVSNPVGTMTYVWDDASMDAQNSRLEDGMAYVTVTDGNQCSTVDSVYIDAGNAFVVQDSIIPLLCSDSKAQISLTMQAGTGLVSYQWANGFGTDSVLTNLDAGVYEVTATDDAGCIENLSFDLQAPPALVVDTTVTNVLCFGANTGKIIPSINGGTVPYSLTWGTMGAADSLVDLAAGTYQLTVLDSNSCQQDITIEITEPSELQALTSTILPTCPTDSSGSISFLGAAQGTAPYTYLWSNSSVDTLLTDLPIGTYDVVITDANNCTKTASFTVPEVLAPELDTAVTSVSCYGKNDGAVQLELITGDPADIDYTWSNALTTQNISSLAPGPIDVVIGFGNDRCSMSYDFVILEPDSLDIALVNKIDVLCNGDSSGLIEVATSGGTSPYEIQWNSNLSTSTINNIPSGNYILLLTDDNGCTKNESYSIVEPDPIVLATKSTLDTCNQNTGAIQLAINGGVGAYTISWIGNSMDTFASGLAQGIYSVEVLDDNNCTLSDSVIVNSFGNIPALELPADTLTCTRTLIDILAKSDQNGLSYTWQGPLATIPNDSTFSTDMAGQYDLLVISPEGCSNTGFVIIEQDTVAPNLIIFSDSLYVPCDDDFISLSPNTVSTGSDFTNTWTIWEGSQMVNQVDGTDLNAIRTALYVHSVTNIKNGCTSSDSVFVRNPEPLSITFEKEDISCKGADDGLFDISVANGGTPAYMYSVDNQPFVSNGLFQNMTPGLHSVEVHDGEDCTWSSQFVIDEPDSFSVDLTLDSSAVYLGGFAILRAKYLPEDALVANISWSSTPTSVLSQDTLQQVVYPEQPTEYIVQLMDDKGCIAEDRVMIDVYNIKIFAPNIIKPNSNEDFGFTLFGSEDVEEIIQLRIYDRWGAMVYENSNFDLNDPTLGWDGTVLGKPANPNVFVWTAEVRMRDGKSLSLKGDVMVAR